jgi:hypothetical protein
MSQIYCCTGFKILAGMDWIPGKNGCKRKDDTLRSRWLLQLSGHRYDSILERGGLLRRPAHVPSMRRGTADRFEDRRYLTASPARGTALKKVIRTVDGASFESRFAVRPGRTQPAIGVCSASLKDRDQNHARALTMRPAAASSIASSRAKHKRI